MILVQVSTEGIHKDTQCQKEPQHINRKNKHQMTPNQKPKERKKKPPSLYHCWLTLTNFKMRKKASKKKE